MAKINRIQQRREKILEYNSRFDDCPLIFVDYGRKQVFIPKENLKFNKDGGPNIYRLVISILEMCNKYYSASINGVLETSPGRNRSSFDIWRHAKMLYPDIDVFRIMEVLHRLCKERAVYGQYCFQVKRAVFYISDRAEFRPNWLCREYKIVFNTWKKLHE